MSRPLLILDDEVTLVEALARHLERQGYAPTRAYLVSEAVRAIEQSIGDQAPFEAIVTDLQLPDGDGRTIVRLAREKLPRCPVIVVTGSRSVSGTVDAIRLGAVTVLEKPVSLSVLERELAQSISARRALGGGLEAAGAAGIIGRSGAIREALDVLFLAAPTEATVLIQGETGTGKELVAQALHRLSRRFAGPFVPVNCAALAETLVEDELFGHARGAFTGADRAREGRFQQADRGTLFLDEIGEMALPLQAKLLRALQEGEVQPLGAERAKAVDVRVVAATNKDLSKMVESGAFRRDLYYRLNVVTLQLPPLRDRREDIAALAAHFLGGRRLTPEAMAALQAWDWPGNVRELENLAQRLLVLKPRGDLDVADLPVAMRGGPRSAAREGPPPPAAEAIDLYAVLGEMEDRLIREALERSGGNRNQAAQALGIKRTTLVEKLRRMSRK
jgi:two-component system response regulator HydG